MKLHNDKERFYEAITATSTMFGIEPALVEKDYYDETTSKLLTGTVSYDEAIKSLQTVIDSGLFETKL